MTTDNQTFLTILASSFFGVLFWGILIQGLKDAKRNHTKVPLKVAALLVLAAVAATLGVAWSVWDLLAH